MKFKILFLLLCLFFTCISCDGDLALSGNAVKHDELSSMSMNYMESLVVSLEDASSIGISKVSVGANSRGLTSEERSVHEKYRLCLINGYLSSIVYFNVASPIDSQTVKIGEKEYGIGDIVSQDDINGVIDKLYVSPEFIFISFIPGRPEEFSKSVLVNEGTTTRQSAPYVGGSQWNGEGNTVNGGHTAQRTCVFPNMTLKYKDDNGKMQKETITYRPENLKYTDSIGVAEYDMFDYYSSDLRKSFVISRKDNKIYKIEGMTINIDEYTGIPRVKEYGIVKLVVNATGELEVHQIIFPQAITPIEVFQDKYGHIFVLNSNYVEERNEDLGIFYYYSSWQYLKAKDGTVIYCEYRDANGNLEKNCSYAPYNSTFEYYFNGNFDGSLAFFEIGKNISNNKTEMIPLTKESKYLFDYLIYTKWRGTHLGEIRDGKMFLIHSEIGHRRQLQVVDFINNNIRDYPFYRIGKRDESGEIFSSALCINRWPNIFHYTSENDNDVNFDVFNIDVVSAYNEGVFDYYDIFNQFDEPYFYSYIFERWKTPNLNQFDSCDLLLENVRWDRGKAVYTKTTATTKKDYFFEQDQNTGKMKAYVVGDYVAPKEPISVFQPL